jgi:hypothetical protein
MRSCQHNNCHVGYHEQTLTERLRQELSLERKEASMLQAVREQKDRHICILVQEKDRLSEQVCLYPHIHATIPIVTPKYNNHIQVHTSTDLHIYR